MIFSMIHLVLISVIILALISVIILAPWFLYKNPSRRMILFYQRMSYSTHCRLFYGKILLLTLILFHFVCYWMKPGEYGVMLSTVMVFYLFSAKRTLSLINGIRNSRGVMVFVFTGHGVCLHNSTGTIVHTSHVQSRCDFGLHSSGSRFLSFKSAGG